MLPGIFDSHNHMLQVGVKLSRIRLDQCRSPEEMMGLVRGAPETPPRAMDRRPGLERVQLLGGAAPPADPGRY